MLLRPVPVRSASNEAASDPALNEQGEPGIKDRRIQPRNRATVLAWAVSPSPGGARSRLREPALGNGEL
jgi:hypothetical protein